MGLTNSLFIGQTALTASQIALQVTGNNIANVATPGFHRQVVTLEPTRGGFIGNRATIGRGVELSRIARAIDPALQNRLRSTISDQQAAQVGQAALSQLEALTNELTGRDLSSQLSSFFNSFSEVANDPTSAVVRAAAVENGAALTSFIRGLREDVLRTRDQLDAQLRGAVDRADGLLTEIADLNKAVVLSELGGNNGEDGNLRDQRDFLISELAALVDISVQERESGAVDIFVDSKPVVLGTESRGLELRIRSTDDELLVEVITSASQEVSNITSGQVGALLDQRDNEVQRTLEDIDELSAAIIHEVNRVHTSGRPTSRITDLTGTRRVPPADRALAFNDPANETFADLPFRIRNGSFEVIVHDGNGNASTTVIEVDLDGIDLTGAAGFTDDTSLDDLVAALDSITNLNASLDSSGQIRLTTDAGFDVSFASDTSGALAVLGVNTFFSGEDGSTIAVRQALRSDPGLLSVGADDGINTTALGIAQLRTRGVQSLNGGTLIDRWLQSVEETAVRFNSTNTRAQALNTVRQSLEAQEAAVGGVSLDEESLNLITYQQQFTGASRFLSVVQELTDILVSLI
ncbi:MAG: flagellar hook-associated protein FlgK [Phycisphaerales bacterium]